MTPPYDAIEAPSFYEDGISFRLEGREYRVPLFGKYQYRNAVMAITVARALNGRGLTVSEEHIVEGLAKVRWGGRFERLASKPLFIYDGGHNPQGVTAAVNT